MSWERGGDCLFASRALLPLMFGLPGPGMRKAPTATIVMLGLASAAYMAMVVLVRLASRIGGLEYHPDLEPMPEHRE